MRILKIEYIFYLVIFFIFTANGCANSARFRFESTPVNTTKDGPQMTMARLADDWTDYYVYYSGLKTTLANGILFDPKNDDKVLRPEGVEWVKVDDEESFRVLLHWHANPSDYLGILFRIMSPDDQFFGYIYIHRNYYSTWAKVIDENTMVVYPILVHKTIPNNSFD